MNVCLGLVLATCKRQKLENMKTIFRPKPVVAENGIKDVELFVIDLLTQGVRKQRGRTPDLGIFFFLVVIERSNSLRSLTWLEGKFEFMKGRAKGRVLLPPSRRKQPKGCRRNQQKPSVFGR